MTQPRAVIERIDGIEAESRYYPESNLTIAEYWDGGEILIQVTYADGNISRVVNARYQRPGYEPLGCYHSDAHFNRLIQAYLTACARHRATPRSTAANREFFDQTRGHGVLWSHYSAP